jgi:hypothetical protein
MTGAACATGSAADSACLSKRTTLRGVSAVGARCRATAGARGLTARAS